MSQLSLVLLPVRLQTACTLAAALYQMPSQSTGGEFVGELAVSTRFPPVSVHANTQNECAVDDATCDDDVAALVESLLDRVTNRSTR